ncbi:unnamed protein product [Medioppia subpectinata]|uniref:Uncharacterized protein n=1 Tax=Medioppia subpectinata TaxID=1979941 RepID=A0A7R9KKH1_9ACAR|nr:unnamed protein product [Medioppia subpectinata]CAG2105249.1 unnamed protein product [Medioppia subpectinata]
MFNSGGQLHNYSGVFAITGVTYLLALLWTVYMVDEEKDIQQWVHLFSKVSDTDIDGQQTIIRNKLQTFNANKDQHPLRLLLNLGNVKQMFTTCFKRRPNHLRRQIWLLFLSMTCYMVSHIGPVFFMYQFTQKVYAWDSMTYSNGASIAIIAITAGTMIIAPILLKVFKFRDTTLSMVGLVSYFILNLVRGLVLTPAGYYYSLIGGCLGGVASIGIRSHFSKIIRLDELGKVFSGLSAIEALTPLISAALFTGIFNATMDSMPGLSLIVVAVILIIPFGNVPIDQLIQDKICRVEYRLAANYCRQLSTLSADDDYLHMKSQILADGSTFTIYQILILTLPSVLATLFIGSWTDTYIKAKKAILIAGAVAAVCEAVMLCLNSYYFDLSQYVILTTLLPNVFTGGLLSLRSAIWTYIASATPPNMRALRMTVAEFTIGIAQPFGTYIGGLTLNTDPMFNTTGQQLRNYFAPFILSALVFSVTLVWTVYAVDEERDTRVWLEWFGSQQVTVVTVNSGTDTERRLQVFADHRHRHPVRLLFNTNNCKEMFRSCFKRRDSHRRLHLWLLFLSMAGYLLASTGPVVFMFQFAQRIYSWDSKTYSNASALSALAVSLATLAIAPILLKVLNVSDTGVSLIGLAAYFGQNLIRGLWLSSDGFFYSLIPGCLGSLPSIGMRSLFSTLVLSEELGKIFSFLGCIEAIVPLIAISADYCTKLPSMTGAEDTLHIKSDVLTDSTNFNIYYFVLNTVPAVLTIMFIGSWCDTYIKAKKTLLIVGAMACLCESVILILNDYFFDQTYLLVLLSLVPSVCTVGPLALLTAIWSYATSTTPKHMRATRMTVMEIITGIAQPLGTYIGGLVLNTQPFFTAGQLHNYSGVFALMGFVYAFALLWTIYMVDEEKAIRDWEGRYSTHCDKVIELKMAKFTDNQHNSPIRLLFDVNNVKSMAMSCVKRRPNSVRLQIWCLFVSMACYLLQTIGPMIFLYQFSQKVYSWDSSTYSTAAAVGNIAITLGTLAVSPVLLNVFKLRDTSLAMIGLVSYFSLNLTRGLWLSPNGFYYSLIPGCLGPLASIGIRSHFSKIIEPKELGQLFSYNGLDASKIIEPKELGQLFSCMSTIEGISPLIASTVFTTIFNETMDSTPGLAFILVSALLAIPFATMVWIHWFTTEPELPHHNHVCARMGAKWLITSTTGSPTVITALAVRFW